MSEKNFRCNCPITSTLDIVGDKWSLVVVKQMLIEGKNTFKDFVESEESIATNILSARLKLLEEEGFIQKFKLPNNKKTNIYQLTEKGVSLTSIIVEMAVWGEEYLRPQKSNVPSIKKMIKDCGGKDSLIRAIQNEYLEKISTQQKEGAIG